jgi:hypothetical protein
MYGSQVWGIGFLQAGREFSSPLSTLHLHFLKGTLGVKQSTTNWVVLRECGHEPLQFYWFRSAVKLFSSMLNTNSDTLRRVVQADLNLQPRSSACWTAQLLSAFQGLRGCELYVRALVESLSLVHAGDFQCILLLLLFFTSCSNWACYSHARVYCRFEA